MKTPKLFLIFIIIFSIFVNSYANALLFSYGITLKSRKGGTIIFSDDIHTSRIEFGETFVYLHNITLKSGFLEIIGINCDNGTKINIISISKDKIVFFFSLETTSEASFYIEKPPTTIKSAEWRYYPNNTLKIISETPRKITIDFTKPKQPPPLPPYYPPSPPPKPKKFIRTVSISLSLISNNIRQTINKPLKDIQKILDRLIAILAELIIKINKFLNTPLPKPP